MAAFAAESPAGGTASFTGGSATLTSDTESINNLVVDNTGTLTWDVSFTDGTTSNFGTLVLTFNVGSQYNGQTATITVNHSDGTVDTTTQTVSNGQVTVTLTKLSTVSISFSGSSSNASSTSPRTGADMTLLTVLGVTAIIAAAGATVAFKRTQN